MITDNNRLLAGSMLGLFSVLYPVKSLIICAVIFISIDFVTGVIASYKRDRRAGRKWRFESNRAWNTVYKMIFVMAGVVLSWMIDEYILYFTGIKLANIFTGFICGVEFWSYLENAADISQHPAFTKVRSVMKNKLNQTFEGNND